MEGVRRIQRWWADAMFPGEGGGHSADRVSPTVQRMLLAGLVVMTCVLFAARLDHPLLEPEEARYAEIPRQMLVQGHFLTPVLHDEAYWQKPPLLYWLVMACYQIFGVHDWAARLVPCLAGIGCVLIVTAWARRTLGFWAGFLSGAILTLSIRFLYLAGMVSMDGPLCTCVIGGLAAGHLALVEPARRWRWVIVSALACALGVLIKGPVALVLIGVPLGLFGCLDRRASLTLRDGKYLAGYLAVVVLVAGPWFGYMAWQAPGAAGTFFWLHHLTRYVAPFDHEKPAWFYLPSLLLGMMPWTMLLIPLAVYLGRRSHSASRRRPAALGLFVIAFVWCVAFFSASGCKRQGYILPAFPLLAMILGTFVTHGLAWTSRLGRLPALRLIVAAGGMGIAIAVALVVAKLSSWNASVLPMLLLAVVVGAICIGLKRLPAWAGWAVCAGLVFGVILCGQLLWLPEYHARFGVREQVALAAEYEQEEPLPILTFPKRWDSISFYTQRGDVASYSDIDQLLGDLRHRPQALVFVRRDRALRELENALPKGMQVEFLDSAGAQVVVGRITTRAAESTATGGK